MWSRGPPPTSGATRGIRYGPDPSALSDPFLQLQLPLPPWRALIHLQIYDIAPSGDGLWAVNITEMPVVPDLYRLDRQPQQSSSQQQQEPPASSPDPGWVNLFHEEGDLAEETGIGRGLTVPVNFITGIETKLYFSGGHDTLLLEAGVCDRVLTKPARTGLRVQWLASATGLTTDYLGRITRVAIPLAFLTGDNALVRQAVTNLLLFLPGTRVIVGVDEHVHDRPEGIPEYYEYRGALVDPRREFGVADPAGPRLPADLWRGGLWQQIQNQLPRSMAGTPPPVIERKIFIRYRNLEPNVRASGGVDGGCGVM